MNRKDIVKITANKMGINKSKDIENLCNFIENYETEIKNAVSNGETVNLVGYMKISPKVVPARECHFITDPNKRFIKEHYSVNVKVSKSFKNSLINLSKNSSEYTNV